MRFSKLILSMAFFVSVFYFVDFKLEAAIDPVVIEVHYQNGIKYYKRGLYEKAIEEFDKTLALDPSNKDAAQYREKVVAFYEKKKSVDAVVSRDVEIQNLYTQGKNLYARRNYHEAIGVFDKILELKPIDDVASDYKDKCDAAIRAVMLKEQKAEEKSRQADRNKAQVEAKKKEVLQKKAEHQTMLDERKRIDEERKQAQVEKSKEAREEKVKAKKSKVKAPEKAVEVEKVVEAEPVEKPVVPLSREEQKIEAKKQRAREQKQAKEVANEERNNIKELYLEGVENFGRHQYQASLSALEGVIEAEKNVKKKIYSAAAKRFMDRVKKRMEQPEPLPKKSKDKNES